jgi:hypothetical protein
VDPIDETRVAPVSSGTPLGQPAGSWLPVSNPAEPCCELTLTVVLPSLPLS